MSKILRIWNKNLCAGAIFERIEGKWICTKAAPIISWMESQNDMNIIKGWLKRKGIEYEWIKD